MTFLVRLCLAAAFAALPSGALAGTSPVGLWAQVDDKSGETRSLVEIYEAGSGVIEGKIVKLVNPAEPDPVCKACPADDPRHGQPIEGLVILTELTPDKKGEAWGGAILDPEDGKTYRAKVWVGEAGALMVRGYWGMLYRTQSWLPANAE